jgi:hypothetical protein
MNRLLKMALASAAVGVVASAITAIGFVANWRYEDANARIKDLDSRVSDLQRRAHPRWRVREKSLTFKLTGTNTVHRVQGDLGSKEPGHIVAAWVSDWAPLSGMAKFESLRVSPLQDTARFEIVAQSKPGESGSMDCTVTFIVE